MITLSISSCAGLGSINRSYVDEMDHQTDGFFIPGQDFPVTSGDQGVEGRSRKEIQLRTPSSFRSKEASLRERSVREELISKVNGLSGRDLNQYQLAKRYLPTDSDKIFYLNLPRYERTEYLISRGDKGPKKKSQAKGMSFFESRATRLGHVSVGMSKKRIIDMWGRPGRVDIAGNPRRENERWSFYENGKIRQVFFESGKVEGWSIE